MRESVSDQLKLKVQKSIERFKAGDEVSFDVGIVLHPQNGLFYFINVIIPGVVLGTSQSGILPIPEGHKILQDQVDDLVREMLTQLRTARSNSLKDTIGDKTELVLPR